MNTMEIDGKTYQVQGYADDGLPIIKGIATSTQDGFDENGNPKVSTTINIPALVLGVEVGKNG